MGARKRSAVCFRVSEAPGEVFSLRSMLRANPDTPDVLDWLRHAKPGDKYRDIVTVSAVRCSAKRRRR